VPPLMPSNTRLSDFMDTKVINEGEIRCIYSYKTEYHYRFSQIYYTFVLLKELIINCYGTSTDHLQHFK
jgi:hypothetical protein